MDYKIFEKEEFNCLTQRQKEILTQMVSMSKGQTAGEAAGMIMRLLPALEKEGPLTAQQKRAMALCIVESMSEEEKMRAAKIFRFAGII